MNIGSSTVLRRGAILTGLAVLTVLALVFAGCLGGSGGGLTISGSTTVLPIVQQAAEAYMDANDVDIIVSGGGSSVGVKAAGEGTADLGMASRDLKDFEFAEYDGLKGIVVARDGLAIVTHPSNPVTGLTVDQVKRIYQGDITNWQEVGGDDLEIVAVGRDSASGTRGAFDELVLDKEDPTASMQEKNSNGAVHETVKGNENAIGYLGLGYLDDNVAAVAIEWVMPSSATVVDGTYPISRPLNIVSIGEPTGLALEFIDYLLSKAGQQIVADEGFVPIG